MITIEKKTVPHAYRSKYMRAGYAKGKYGKSVNYIAGNNNSSSSGGAGSGTTGGTTGGSGSDGDEADNPLG